MVFAIELFGEDISKFRLKIMLKPEIQVRIYNISGIYVHRPI